MTNDFKPSGIAGMTGRPSFGASVQIGRRYGDSPTPKEKDQFHIMTSHEVDGKREFAPGFDFWNHYPRVPGPWPTPDGKVYTDEQVRAEIRKRKTIQGVIVHGSWNQCLQQHWSAQVLAKSAPGRQPACQGDGRRARRWVGEKGPDDWRMIDSCGDGCPFTQAPAPNKPAPCKPLTRFAFRLDWHGTPAATNGPTPVVRFASKGFHTFRSFLGLREDFESTALSMGLSPKSVPPFGLRFRLEVMEITKPGRKFPAVEIVPICSVADHIASVMRTLSETRQLAQAAPPLLIGDDDFVADVNSLEVR